MIQSIGLRKLYIQNLIFVCISVRILHITPNLDRNDSTDDYRYLIIGIVQVPPKFLVTKIIWKNSDTKSLIKIDLRAVNIRSFQTISYGQNVGIVGFFPSSRSRQTNIPKPVSIVYNWIIKRFGKRLKSS